MRQAQLGLEMAAVKKSPKKDVRKRMSKSFLSSVEAKDDLGEHGKSMNEVSGRQLEGVDGTGRRSNEGMDQMEAKFEENKRLSVSGFSSNGSSRLGSARGSNASSRASSVVQETKDIETKERGSRLSTHGSSRLSTLLFEATADLVSTEGAGGAEGAGGTVGIEGDQKGDQKGDRTEGAENTGIDMISSGSSGSSGSTAHVPKPVRHLKKREKSVEFSPMVQQAGGTHTANGRAVSADPMLAAMESHRESNPLFNSTSPGW